MGIEVFAEDRWEFRVEHKGISIFSAKLESSDIMGFKGHVVLKVPLRKLIALFHDFESYHRWVHHLLSMQLLEKGEQLDYIVRQVIDAPWPLKPMEMLIRTGVAEEGSEGVAVTMVSEPEFIPEDSRFQRVRETYGKWIFIPGKDDQVDITFMMHMHPGENIPSGIVNTALFEVPFYSLQNLRRLAEDERYSPPYPSDVDEFIAIH
ncbi:MULTISPECIES: SRPBCC family protein [Prosthecochloris]|uniref:Coenzyme Q-binding protein COQ10 START domain-containing protein n=1 Tax=Prosthecochloris vibrioformis TaxID=1098 RepID=A0A5C4S1R4_PROVB|nr:MULTISPECIES: SRPBCC family protein [Prosthecochloris]ANT64848.1 Polyketide cyclase / dehydrase and lipid transport [Prosthecochloris sp. CIB 2401]TNJ37067.1 hypothetical protein FGF68_05720 [Prosthecochloris vibrioformis]